MEDKIASLRQQTIDVIDKAKAAKSRSPKHEVIDVAVAKALMLKVAQNALHCRVGDVQQMFSEFEGQIDELLAHAKEKSA